MKKKWADMQDHPEQPLTKLLNPTKKRNIPPNLSLRNRIDQIPRIPIKHIVKLLKKV